MTDKEFVLSFYPDATVELDNGDEYWGRWDGHNLWTDTESGAWYDIAEHIKHGIARRAKVEMVSALLEWAKDKKLDPYTVADGQELSLLLAVQKYQEAWEQWEHH